MAKLTIRQNETVQTLCFEPPLLLSEALERCGIWIAHPCGGRGSCGKCAVTLNGAVSEPDAAEQAAKTRLACRAVLLGDATVRLSDSPAAEQIQLAGTAVCAGAEPMPGDVGAAVDVGTTTLALQLYELKTGRLLGQAAAGNPQRSVAADVMGRIQAAMEGGAEKLRQQVLLALEKLLAQACREAAIPPERVEQLVVTGNTTMLYLLTGQDTACLSRAPFQADTLFDLHMQLLGRRAYLPACMDAFVGADITCAVLASTMCRKPETALLCDIGTNGELALWKDGTLYVTSTAAGPAFEGAGITCGCGSVAGAIDRAWVQDGKLCVHTIAEQPAAGICGSGLIDLVAAGLELEEIDETGAMEELPLGQDVTLYPQDIRAVQLAKAAIAAGIGTLLKAAGVEISQVSRLYIAGGFGSHLNISSAVRIGLIPGALADRVTVLGNAALSGAAGMLLNRQSLADGTQLAARSVHIQLGGNPGFNEAYMEQMLFPEQ